jgi:hypothetical protein
LVESQEPLSLEEHKIKITQLVRAYFAQHPRAMDTAAGIMEWWIPVDKIRTNPDTVKQVLDEMTEQGFLEQIGSGDYAHYRMRSDDPS